ncbi:MAG: hypothetical protein A2156_12050 [Deltaproteobacteria bacterium RBG_16_48_10]|nr:MAG: hypothetical protein A2156_12050 [Deltaproteobacteria bacterium RBG_16_48_10]
MILIILGMVGCATTPPKPPQPAAPAPRVSVEDQIEARVKAYWDARQKADLPTAYTFYSPGFKEKTPRELFLRNYRRLIRFPLDSISIESIKIDPSNVRALVRLKVSINQVIEGKELLLSTYPEETWVYVENQWWKETEPFLPNI